MRILLWGSRGWIGGMFTKYAVAAGHEVIAAKSRADDREAVGQEIAASKPTHLFCLIGRTHGVYEGVAIGSIDYLEKPGKLVENVRDNLMAPVVLSFAAMRHGLHLTYIGTGCIFEYDGCGGSAEVHVPRQRGDFEGDVCGFKESDKPNFTGSSYSTVKGFTDMLVGKEFAEHVLNVRIRMPISAESNERNLINKILKYKNIIGLPNSVTVLDDLLPRLLGLMEKGTTGTLNACNPGTLYPGEILDMYKKYVDANHEWTETSKAEIEKQLGNGRSNNCMDVERLLELCPDFPSAYSSVEKIMKEWRYFERVD